MAALETNPQPVKTGRLHIMRPFIWPAPGTFTGRQIVTLSASSPAAVSASATGAAAPVAVITGGARGIGLGIAHWFLAHGHRVALLDIDQRTLAATAAQLNDPVRVLTVHCDVSQADQAQPGRPRVFA